jgi:hypothetical protein
MFASSTKIGPNQHINILGTHYNLQIPYNVFKTCPKAHDSTQHQICEVYVHLCMLQAALNIRPCLDAKFQPQISMCKKKIPITSKCRHMHGVLNVDEIKN